MLAWAARAAGGARMTAATVTLLDGTDAQLDSEAHRRRGKEAWDMAMKQEIADALLRLVGEMEPASFRDLWKSTGLKEDTARRIAQDLRKRGCIDFLGGGRRAAWYAVGSEAHTAAVALAGKIRERREESARRSLPDHFVHRVVSVEESGVYVPRHAVASVWDLGRIAARDAEPDHAAG